MSDKMTEDSNTVLFKNNDTHFHAFTHIKNKPLFYFFSSSLNRKTDRILASPTFTL